ncbi:hypothetical protein AALO_G00239040 [Alosa alosa]|uniref:Uncharacterized protein n=1 Tax=Alosa alosa TaxID=278164 RepID=A0AAV6FZB0_9TELE|nr:hypothetical protein AALO_G00239040 [Alosa alosa]
MFRSDGGEEVTQLLLPTVLQEEVLQQLHQGHGHQESTSISGSVDDWLQEHQQRLQTAFDGAKERLREAARIRKERNDQHLTSEDLQEGDLMYLQNKAFQGRAKIQDTWGPRKYQIIKAPSNGSAVYSIALVVEEGNLGPVKTVHRMLLRPVPINHVCSSRPRRDPPVDIPPDADDPESELWVILPPQPEVNTTASHDSSDLPHSLEPVVPGTSAASSLRGMVSTTDQVDSSATTSCGQPTPIPPLFEPMVPDTVGTSSLREVDSSSEDSQDGEISLRRTPEDCWKAYQSTSSPQAHGDWGRWGCCSVSVTWVPIVGAEPQANIPPHPRLSLGCPDQEGLVRR